MKQSASEDTAVLNRHFMSRIVVAVILMATIANFGIPKVFAEGPTKGIIALGIVNSSSKGTVGVKIQIMKPDGSGLTTVVEGQYQCPQLSHDGRSLTFWTKDGSIWTFDLTAKDAQPTKVISQDGGLPAWTPDNKHIVFSGLVTSGLYIADADGANRKQLTQGSNDSWVDVSPDGTKLTYVNVNADGKTTGIYVAGIDGSNVQLRTPKDTPAFHPHWSSDGSAIAFTMQKAGKWELYTMKPDGTDVRRVAAVDRNFTWSPDGSQIIYMSGANPKTISVMNADGSKPRKLTTIPLKQDEYIDCLSWALVAEPAA